MKVIVFNNLPSLLMPTAQSVSLRTGYLLANRVAAAGTFAQDILFDAIPHSPSYIQKTKIIELFCEKTHDPFPEAQRIIQMLKTMAKIKHKNREQIIVEKQIQKNIDNLYHACIDQMKEKTVLSGLSVLGELVDGQTFGMYYMGLEDVESSEKTCVPASNLLSFQLPDPEEGPELFFLPPEFFPVVLENKKKIFSIADKEAEKADNSWLHKCFSLPNINLFTPLELTTVRKQLEQPGAEFRKQSDAWITAAKDCSEEESVHLFKKNVAGHAASFQAAIAQNELLNHCFTSQRVEAKADVWVGEIPFMVLWDFYKNMQVIKEPTWEKLMALKEKDPRFGKRVAVIALSLNGVDAGYDLEQAKKEVSEPSLQPVKKSISVD